MKRILPIAAVLLVIAVTLVQLLHLMRRNLAWRTKFETHKLIQQYAINPELRNALRYLRKHQLAIPSGDFQDDPEFHDAARTVANFFESVCSGIQQNVYDEQIVKENYGATVVGLYKVLERYVHEIRARTNNPDIYSAFVSVAEKWSGRRE